MSSTDPFQILGLNRASATQADVKKAYARLLKVTRPEDDRDAFMRLRQAFDAARIMAKEKDAHALLAPVPAAKSSDKTSDEISGETPPAPAPMAWHYDKNLKWRFQNSPQGKLTEDTVRWMLKGGPDADMFAADVAERQIASPDIDANAYRLDVIAFIFQAADPDEISRDVPVWKPFKGTRPDWLSLDLIHTLHKDFQLLAVQPTGSYAARSINTLRTMFAAATADTTPQDDPLDVLDIFAKETHTQNKDAYGSYYDKQAKKWIDMSPVSRAMRDILAAFDKGMWDTADVCRNILAREDLQALEEFQSLDSQLRRYICQQTGNGSHSAAPVYPIWLRKSVILLLDDTFGWSRHYGRMRWEQQQYTWLHKVIARDRDVIGDVNQFQVVDTGPKAGFGQKPAVAAPATPGTDFDKYFAYLFGSPARLLVVYFGYRLTQFVWRLVG